MRLAPLLALVCAVLPTEAAGAQGTAAQREARVRTWALGPVRSRAELESAARDVDWQQRFLAVDALSRVSAEREQVAWILALLEDEHVNVRSAAWLSLAHAQPRTLDAVTVDLLLRARDVAALEPAEASAWVTCLRLRAPDLLEPERVVAPLRALSAHPNGRVASDALRALWVLGPDAAPFAGDGPVAARLEPTLLVEGRLDVERVYAAAPHLVRAGFDTSGFPGRLIDERTPLHERAVVRGLEQRLAAGTPHRDLIAGWVAPGAEIDAARDSFFDAVARSGSVGLGAELLVAARRHVERGQLDAAARLVASAAEALPPAEMARAALSLPPELAAEAWDVLDLRPHTWTAGELAPWLDLARDDALRFDIARLAADTWLRGAGDAALGDLLQRLVLDRDAGLRIASFRWICDAPDFAARVGALHVAWRALPRAARLERARDLPRAADLAPFRDDLVALAERRATRTESVVELLGGFADCGALLAKLLDEELQGLERAAEDADAGAYRAAENRARALARSLARAAPERVDALGQAIARQLAHPAPPVTGARHGWELAKTCAALLARSAAGRARLPDYLGDSLPLRLRLEAILGLLVRGGTAEHPPRRVIERLLARDHAQLDTTLRVRVLEALARLDDPASGLFLSGVVRNAGLPLEQRLAAVASLEARGGEPLIGLSQLVEQYEVRLSVIEALGRLATPAAVDALRALRARLLGQRALAELATDQGDAVLAISRALLAADAFDDAYLGEVLARPRAAARADLEARFRGVRLPGPKFRWRAELDLASDLARGGRLAAVLDGAGAWWTLDARFLQVLGEHARSFEPSRRSALRLFVAARVGLAGEAVVAGDAGRVERILLAEMALAEQLADWDAFIVAADRLHARALVRAGRLRTLEEVLGVTDAREGVDPLAQVASARWQARAWRALAGGDSQAAVGFAERASRAVRSSLRARSAQERLEAALER